MSLVYRVPGRSTTVTYRGRTEFARCTLPTPVKNEYGVDVMTIDYIGAAPLLGAFLKGLRQGQRFDFDGNRWFLQSWSPDGDRVWPTVTLVCKGLAEGRLPDATTVDNYVTQSLTVAALVTESQGDPPEDVEVSVIRDISYRALQTTWTYITRGRPKFAKYGRVSRDFSPQMLSSVITANGGTTNATYSGANAPAPYAIATLPGDTDVLLDLQAVEIFGTDLFEVDEVVCRMFTAV